MKHKDKGVIKIKLSEYTNNLDLAIVFNEPVIVGTGRKKVRLHAIGTNKETGDAEFVAIRSDGFFDRFLKMDVNE